ncbi:MAG: beta-lactamase regulating signal transducer with metallopeptidase domain [Planctomycetota bacterium]|jgi:beta-lactamase regulating signal transducer with metallopeptidase domain
MLAKELELQTIAWLLTYALHSTVLLGIAWLIAGRLWKGSERASELVWKAALVGGLLTASVQQFVNVEPISGHFLIATPSEEAEAVQEPKAASDVPLASAVGQQVSPTHAQGGRRTRKVDLAALSTDQLLDMAERLDSESTAPILGQLSPRSTSATMAPPRRWTSLALIGWGLGGGLLMLATLVAWRRLRDHLAGRTPITEGPLTVELETLRSGAGMLRKVRLSSSDRLTAPIATGVLFPQICIPSRSLRDLDIDECRSMLAHELAHIRRLDPLWLSVGQVVQMLFFFQPLNRLARKRMEYSAEMLCDAQAVEWTGERVALARCLTKVAGWVVADRRQFPACAMAHLTSPLGARVQGILKNDASIRRGGRVAAPATVAFIAGTTLIVPGFAGQQILGIAPLLDAVSRVESTHTAETDASMTLPSLASKRVPNTLHERLPATDTLPVSEIERELQTMLESQVIDLESLEAEITHLREEMEADGADEAAWQRLRTIEHRVSTVRTLGSRVHDILKQLETESEVTATSLATPQLGDD